MNLLILWVTCSQAHIYFLKPWAVPASLPRGLVMRLWAFLFLVLGSEREGEGSLSLSLRPRADAGQKGGHRGAAAGEYECGQREGQTALDSGCPGPAGRRRWGRSLEMGQLVAVWCWWLGRVHVSQATGSARGLGRSLLALRRAISGVWQDLKTDGESQEWVGGWQAETLSVPHSPNMLSRGGRGGALTCRGH